MLHRLTVLPWGQHLLYQPGQVLKCQLPQNSGKKFLFAGIVTIQGLLGDASLNPNSLGTRICEPMLKKEPPGGGKDLFAFLLSPMRRSFFCDHAMFLSKRTEQFGSIYSKYMTI